jgi:hypothetical protein
MNGMKVFVLIVFPLAIFAVEANACECAVAGAPCQEYWKASAVFVRTVSYSSLATYKSGEYDLQGRLVRFTADGHLKAS